MISSVLGRYAPGVELEVAASSTVETADGILKDCPGSRCVQGCNSRLNYCHYN